MKQVHKVKIISNTEISHGIYKINLLSKEIAENAKPGQFVNIYTNNPGSLLARPISISQINKEKNILTLIYELVGKGTKSLSEMKENEELKILGPLGNGFTISEEEENHILIGGGIGTPPLVELAKQLKGNIEVYLGFRSKPILIKEFEKYAKKVYIATEDGSVGIKGNVMDILKEKDIKADMIYSCGPKPMLKAVSKYAAEKGIKAQISMEERMACGIGACVACTCKTKNKEEVVNKKICKDGPVFYSSEVIWND